MQHKNLQVRVERHACPTMRDGARAQAREPSSRQRFAADLNSIVSAAHRLPAEVAPPPRVWRSLRLQLEKEGIFRAFTKESLQGRVRTPAFKNRKEQRGATAMREEGLRQGEAKFRALVESIASAIFISRGNRLRYVNHAAEIMTGYSRNELLRMSFQDLVDCDKPEVPPSRKQSRAEEIGLGPRCEVRISTKNHEERWLDITATLVDFDGEPCSMISAFDLTDCKRAEERAQVLAVTDSLTGLGNYRRILDVLRTEIERSGRTGRPFSVLLLDVDGLKDINDRYGHLAGSRALCRVGDVLRLLCRAIDTAARYGGDEFAVILPETNASAAALVASRIRERLSTDTVQPTLSASIGVAVYPRDGETIEGLLQKADYEMYAMKSHRTAQISLLPPCEPPATCLGQ
jgi:diguanylate cyclase (GGDEF)-like protein/PAS domain S-box-containing protein